MLVSCFGKLFQKIGDYIDQIVETPEEFAKFLKNNITEGTIFNDNDTISVYGKTNTKNLNQEEKLKYYQKEIRRPYHIGIFILSYFRAYTLEVLLKLSPDLTTTPFHYISTDAFVITQRQYEILEESDLLFKRTEDFKDSLGKLKDNLASDEYKEGFIFNAEFFSVNQMRYQYVTDTGKVLNHFKSSGIRKENQTWDMFDDKATKFQYDQTLIKHNDGKINVNQRTVYGKLKRNLWSDMKLINGEWYPDGYDLNLIKSIIL